MHYFKTLFLTFFMTFALMACGDQTSNRQNSNPVIPDHFDLPLSYSVKTNGDSEVTIRYTDDQNELQTITIPLPGGIQEFKFDFETPGDIHFISASVPETDSSHTLLFVSTEDFTKNGKYFVEISY